MCDRLAIEVHRTTPPSRLEAVGAAGVCPAAVGRGGLLLLRGPPWSSRFLRVENPWPDIHAIVEWVVDAAGPTTADGSRYFIVTLGRKRYLISTGVKIDTSRRCPNRHGGRRPAIHAFVRTAKGMDADLRRMTGKHRRRVGLNTG